MHAAGGIDVYQPAVLRRDDGTREPLPGARHDRALADRVADSDAQQPADCFRRGGQRLGGVDTARGAIVRAASDDVSGPHQGVHRHHRGRAERQTQ